MTENSKIYYGNGVLEIIYEARKHLSMSIIAELEYLVDLILLNLDEQFCFNSTFLYFDNSFKRLLLHLPNMD